MHKFFLLISEKKKLLKYANHENKFCEIMTKLKKCALRKIKFLAPRTPISLFTVIIIIYYHH